MKIVSYQDVTPVLYGEKIEKRVLIGPKQGAPTFVMRVFDLPPGTSSPYHTHDWEHEVFILSGEGVVVNAEGKTPVKPYDAILIPARMPFASFAWCRCGARTRGSCRGEAFLDGLCVPAGSLSGGMPPAQEGTRSKCLAPTSASPQIVVE